MAIGFGIIGCGVISRFHAQAIAEIRGARLIGCYNRSPQAAERLAESTGCRAYPTLRQLLDDPRIQVVTIATPSGAHAEPAIAAAKAGKHLLIEKPLEVTLERCDAILAAAEKARVRLSTIFPSRYHAASRTVKRAIDEGRFGRLALGSAYVKWFRTQAYYDSGAWRGTWRWDGGGALMNQAIHNVDLLLWLMGPVSEVAAATARVGHRRIEVEDCAVATLKFAHGGLGVVEASTAAFPGAARRLEICGTTGSAAIEDETITRWEFARRRARRMRAPSPPALARAGAADPTSIGHQHHAALFRDTVRSLRDGTPPPIDGREGRRSVELILAIYQAAATGRRVTLPLPHSPRLKPIADSAP